MGRHGTTHPDLPGGDPLPPARETGAGRLIDSHAHLLHLRDGLTPEQALDEARAVGVEVVLNIGDDASDNRPGLELTERIAGLRTTIGRHPHSAGEPISGEERRELRAMAAHPNVVAIGEIGLDYHWTDVHKVAPRAQATLFRQMLALALEVGKPVVLHTRDAFADQLAILDEFPGVEGVFHCFSGNAAIAAEALARGFYLSFAGTVTYPTAHPVIGAASIIPLDRMLVETDSPFLPPQSRRGKPNAPRFLVETVERLATLRQSTAQEIGAATRKNAIDLFRLQHGTH
ncbi:MAG TPA: TatD family hydrolase [Candidatus Dormibacteraeota bacterium]|nr:TatD family hydrolase [Candidatus Dormibacteraeota bacterium]